MQEEVGAVEHKDVVETPGQPLVAGFWQELKSFVRGYWFWIGLVIWAFSVLFTGRPV